jgi:DNA-binding MarR family transcriptional regulator
MKQARRAPADTLDHLQVLEAIDGAGHVSQRALAASVGIAASRVNRIINALVECGNIAVSDETVRPYAYRLTRRGRSYLQELNYDHYAAVVGRFREVEARILARLEELRRDSAERVVFYGAGEVMEVAYLLAQRLGLSVVGVVDDDPARYSTERRIEVGSPASIRDLAPDAVVITTFRHADEIRSRIQPYAPSTLRVIEL